MFRTGELVRDVGTVLIGRDAVELGLIDELGGLSHAMNMLHRLILARGASRANGADGAALLSYQWRAPADPSFGSRPATMSPPGCEPLWTIVPTEWVLDEDETLLPCWRCPSEAKVVLKRPPTVRPGCRGCCRRIRPTTCGRSCSRGRFGTGPVVEFPSPRRIVPLW